MISLSFHLFFSLSLPLLRWLLKSHTYWEAKATVLHNFISFYLRDVPEVCNAMVLQEAFLIDSKILRDFPCLSNLEAAKLITSSGVALYMCLCLVALVISDSFETPWTVAHQAPLSMGFCRQEYWSGLSFPPSKGSSQGLNPCLLCLLHWQVNSFILCHLGSPRIGILNQKYLKQ